MSALPKELPVCYARMDADPLLLMRRDITFQGFTNAGQIAGARSQDASQSVHQPKLLAPNELPGYKKENTVPASQHGNKQ